MDNEIRIGISSCILGNRVRFDGGHKHDALVAESLQPWVKWIAVCPEVELGLGTPRETLHLAGSQEAVRLVTTRSGIDHTDAMEAYSQRRIAELESMRLHGYILKRASPSCGMERVRLYSGRGAAEKKGVGLFARALLEKWPLLPVEEDGRLHDPALRENFIERIFAYHRWMAFVDSAPKPADLVKFHTRCKMTLLSHCQKRYREMGRLVAQAGDALREGRFAALLDEYGQALMTTLKVKATRARHVNVLQHLAGHLKKEIDGGDRAELAECIEQYRLGLVPMVVPMTLVKHHFRRHPSEWVLDQIYVDPYPAELMLRNHV